MSLMPPDFAWLPVPIIIELVARPSVRKFESPVGEPRTLCVLTQKS